MPETDSQRARLLRLAVSAASGAAAAFTMPSWSQAWLAWIVWAPMFFCVLGARPRDAFYLAWTHTFVFFLVSTHWLTFTLTTFAYIPSAVSHALYAALATVLACFPGFACMTLRWLPPRRRWTEPIAAALFWAAWEYFRTVHFNGFPWNLVGYSQHPWIPMIQFAEFTGVYGVSALVIAANWALARAARDLALEGRGARALAPLVLPALLAAAAWGFGARRVAELRDPEGPGLRVAMAQGAVDQNVKWDPKYVETTIRTYERLTREAASAGVDLMIWPETAMPFFFQSDLAGKGRVERLAREAGVHLLFGSPAYGRRPGRREIELRNRAFLLNPEGFEIGEYDKLFLVPFGEYNPLPFVRQIVEAAGNFTPGTDAHVLRFDGRAFGTLICYEGVQPDLPRRFVSKGAGFLVNITNDAWFGKTVAPYQHLVQEAFRAAENKVPMVRAANTGVSAVIRPTGEVAAATGLYEEALLAGEIHPRPGGTFYSRRGNLFAYAAMLYYAGSAIAGYLRRKT